MLFKFLPLLLVSGFCSTASAALYRLTVVNTINYVDVYDNNTGVSSNVITTPYGQIAEGSTLTLTLTYDISDFTPGRTYNWNGGSGVEYNSIPSAVLNITVSSGYSYSGTLGGGGAGMLNLYNQDTAHDQVNYMLSNGGMFMQFNDFPWSSVSLTFTSNPMSALSVADAHAAFAAGVNSGAMALANGLPLWLPGIVEDYDIYTSFNAYSPATASLLAVAPVPEPAPGLMAAGALLGLLARRRRA